MMQASGNQLLEVVESPEGRQYRIEVPKVSAATTNPVWDLTEARILIDAKDYRVTELARERNVPEAGLQRVVPADQPRDCHQRAA